MWKIPLFKIYWDDYDVLRVTNAIKEGMYWAMGPEIATFEKMITTYMGRKFCVVFNAGTSALHAAMIAHGIKEGDEVIVPSFTFVATANAPLFVGARPVFADVEPTTYGLDPLDVEQKITERTKAIVPVHYGGSPCQIEELKDLAEDHDLLLIEDAAESLGAHIGGRMVGTFGSSAILSFCANKVITTGEGGAVVTDSRELYERLMLVRSHGRQEIADYFTSPEYMDYVTLGYNFRMSNITAALGIAQLEKIGKIIDMRRANAEYMTGKLRGIKGVTPPISPKGYFHVYQMYTIQVKGGNQVRDALMRYLSTKGVMTKVYFKPVHLTSFYKKRFGYKGGQLPLTEKLSDRVLTLPMYPTLTKDELDYVADAVSALLSKQGR